MKNLLHSGKFWLRFSVFGLLAVIAAGIGMHTLLLYLFSNEHIQAAADQAVGNRYEVRFGSKIGRTWLPRPTVTLTNVTLGARNSGKPDLHVKEMRIGLSWQSLWGHPSIEKWVWEEAEADITHDKNGRWTFQDLWRNRNDHIGINRFIIENSRINIHTPASSYLTKQFNLKLSRASERSYIFDINGHTNRTDDTIITWESNGKAESANRQWLLPAVHIEADIPFQNHQTKLMADADLTWQSQQNTLQTRNLRLRADSSYHDLHLTAQSPLILWNGNRISSGDIRSVFTAGSEEEGRWDGSFSLSRLNLRPTTATVAKIDLSGSFKHNAQQTTFNFSAPLDWQKNRALTSDGLTLTTYQNQLNAAPQPRFSSQMTGKFTLSANKNWQLQLNGLFDRQATRFSADYIAANRQQAATLEAQLSLSKLLLAPYWKDLQAKGGRLFPTFLNREQIPQIKADIHIGNLAIPGLQIDEIDTILYADNRRIALTNFRAGLYGGHTEGGISIANTDPPAYHLQQNTHGVQIRPLLQDLLNYHGIGGTGDAVIDLTAAGTDRRSLTQTLNGNLQLNVADGAWYGVDMANILKNLSNNHAPGKNGADVQTRFRRFSLNSEISNGISRHDNTELTSDILHISSYGQTNLNTQTVSENLLIRNAANPKAKPVPITIGGSINNPSVTLDYNRLTDGLDSPEERQRALAETLREQWQWLNKPSK
ncbi:AsmA family protein [Neisseria zalophi]|nr:AsmA family protein [Neisseria zalophi]